MYTAESIASLFPDGTHILPDPQAPVRHVCIDSRKAAWQPQAIFLALQGARADGHRYIQDAWNQGVRNFLVQEHIDLTQLPEGNFIRVPNVIPSLCVEYSIGNFICYHRSRDFKPRRNDQASKNHQTGYRGVYTLW